VLVIDRLERCEPRHHRERISLNVEEWTIARSIEEYTRC